MANGNERVPEREFLGEQSFSEIVEHAASTLADCEDPYQKQLGARQSWQGRRQHPDGRIEFGDDHEVGRLWVGDNDFELIFAHNTSLDEAECIVHQFAPEGGLATRSTFYEVNGSCRKSWASGGFTYLEITAGKASSFQRELAFEESAALRHIMAGALEGEDVQAHLEELVSVSDTEQDLIEEKARKIKEDRQAFKAALKTIEELEKQAERDSRDIVIRG